MVLYSGCNGKKYTNPTNFIVNASKVDANIRFLSLHGRKFVEYGTGLETVKYDYSGPFYCHLIYSRSNLDISAFTTNA